MRLVARVVGLGLIATIGLVACATTSSGGAAPAASAAPKVAAVSIKGSAFNPVALEVAKGTVVTWTNEDTTTHTVTSGANRTKDNKFDSAILEQSKTFSFTFDTVGTFEYFCSRHSPLKANVTVK